jgi:hypothetical protein
MKLLETPLQLISTQCQYFLYCISFNLLLVFNLFPFRVDLILWKKKKAGGNKSGTIGFGKLHNFGISLFSGEYD